MVAVDLSEEADASLESAVLTVPFDPALVDDPARARLMSFDEDLRAWIPVAADALNVVNPVAGTVTAPVEHFSDFAVFDIDAYLDAILAAQAIVAECANASPTPTGAAYETEVLASGPVAYWKFDDATSPFSDDAGSYPLSGRTDLVARPAIVPTSAGSAVSIPAQSGGSAQGAVAASGQGPGTLINADGFSFEFWYDGTADGGFTLVEIGSAGDPVFSIEFGGDFGSMSISGQFGGASISSFDLPASAGHYVVAFDGSDVTVWFNSPLSLGGGPAVFVTPGPLALEPSDDQVEFFRVSGGGDAVDDISVYDRPLTDAEVARHYQAGFDPGFDAGPADTDGDGLSDCAELDGMPTIDGRVYTSNPLLVDTDGDTIPDDVEMGSTLGASVPPLLLQYLALDVFEGLYVGVIADPSNEDSDETGVGPQIGDELEYDRGYDPLRTDSDADELSDAQEILQGTDIIDADTDDDGFTDWDEIRAPQPPGCLRTLNSPVNCVRPGDPTFPEDGVTPEEQLALVMVGAVCGELATNCGSAAGAAGFQVPTDDDVTTFPYMVGAVGSALAGGPVVELRDVYGAIRNGDPFGIAFGAAGLGAIVPIGPDSPMGRSIEEAIELVRQASTTRQQQLRLRNLDRILDKLPLDESQRIGFLRQAAPQYLDPILDAGVNPAGLRELIRSGVALDELAPMLAVADDVLLGQAPLATWMRGEEIVQALPGSGPSRSFRDPSNPGGPNNWRRPDGFGRGSVAYEAKTGRCGRQSRTLSQIEKDKELLRATSGGGGYNAMEWHFFPSSITGRICTDPVILAALQSEPNPIRVVVHLP